MTGGVTKRGDSGNLSSAISRRAYSMDLRPAHCRRPGMPIPEEKLGRCDMDASHLAGLSRHHKKLSRRSLAALPT
jgi:hypothetical protein